MKDNASVLVCPQESRSAQKLGSNMTTAINTPGDRPRTPSLLASRIRLGAEWVQRFSAAIAVLSLCVMLVITIYFTLFDLQWIAFLLGILCAAVLGLVSQSIKAQWLIVRRTAQLRRHKELLTEESARTARAAQALKMAESRFRALLDALPLMLFFVGRDARCGQPNLAFEHWCGRNAADIEGSPLRGLVDDAIYQDLISHGAEALLGNETQYEAHWSGPEGGRQVAVKLLPYPVGAQTTSGFYAFVTPSTVAQAKDASETVYLEAMEQELSSDDDAREYLLRAMEEDHFILFEQKIEWISSGRTEAHFREILLRLPEEEKNRLPPGGFFEVAEHYDLMPAIDRWVIRKLLKACAAMKRDDQAWRMPLYFLNLSSATLRDRTFPNHVRVQLQNFEIAGNRLCLEINHEDLADRESDISVLMGELRPLGCHFAVDCFGRHKVSFAPFRHLRFDFLKIDGSIIGGILNDDSELAKVKAIVLACQRIGVRTIAQFVEQEATCAKLREIGVDYVQGFSVGEPGPLALTAPTAGSSRPSESSSSLASE